MTLTQDFRYETVEFDPDTGTYRVAYRTNSGPVSLAVVSAVATVSGTDPVELDPLYSVLDPEGLDAMFGSNRRKRFLSDLNVTFQYNDHEVTVHSGGCIDIRPPSSA